MAETQELIVDLRLKDNLSGGIGAAKAQLTGLENAALSSSSKIRASFAGIGADIKAGIGAGIGIGIPLIAAKAVVEFTGFLRDSVGAAAEEEAGIKRLGQTLKANVQDFDGNTKAIEGNIAARQQLGFDDNELRDSLSDLAAATGNVNEAFKLQRLAMDLARFSGTSLTSATDQLVKVQAGSFRALKALGIELKANATSEEALAAITKVVSGQAEAFGATAEGAMARAGVAVKNLQEDIGRGLLPVIGAAAEGLDRILTKDLPALGENTKREIDDIQDALDFLVNPFGDRGESRAEATARALREEAGAATLAFVAQERLDASLAAGELAWIKMAAATDVGARATKTLSGDIGEADVRMGSFETATDDAARALAAFNLKAANTAATLSGPLNRSLAGTADAMRAFSGLPTEGDQDALTQHRTAQADTQAEMDRRAAEALATAKAAASAYADVLAQKLDRALDQTKRTADTLFDKLHERHLRAINDVEKLAEAQHDATTQQISDALKLKLQQDAAPVTAAEEAQRRLELTRQRRDLGEGLRAAQASGDPTSIRNAQEALQSFNASQRIENLKITQSKLDLAAQTQAAADQKAADDALAAAKLAQAAGIKAETERATKQQAGFDRELAALKVRDKGASPAKFGKDLTALQEKFGITSDPQGFHHIADVVGNAIKTVKIPAPNFSPTIIYNPPVFSINGRVLASYIASAQSPSATPGVRTGALSPRP